MTDHDFARHDLATLLVVSSSLPNPMEQFQQLNDQLTVDGILNFKFLLHW
jgi:hypothetical protein